MTEPMINIEDAEPGVDMKLPEEHTAEELVAWRNQATSTSLEGEFVIVDGLIVFDRQTDDVVDIPPPPFTEGPVSPAPRMMTATDEV